MLASDNKIPTEMRSEEQPARIFDENESTVSSHSVPALSKIAYNTKALSGKPSMFQQTRYLDEIEEILKRRKRQKHTKAV